MKLADIFRASRRFTVDGEPPEDFRARYAAALNESAFREPLSPLAKELRVGWCGFDDPLVTTFDNLNGWLFNQYAVFALRVEQKRVPGNILRPAVRARIEAWCRDNNRERAPAAVRNELTELVEAELLPRTQPTRQTFGVLWNISEGWVVFAGTSVARCDAFRKLFHRTFGMVLVPADPLDVVEEPGALSVCGSIDLVRGTVAPSGEPLDDEDLPPCPPHLAADFCLWLAWRAGEARALDLGDAGTVEHWLDGRLEFRRPGEERACVVVSDESPINAAALGALASGAVIRSIPLTLRRSDREYRVTLTGSDLARRGVKLPALVRGGDVAEQLYEAAFLYEELEFLLGALFREFAAHRPSWGKQGADALRRWLGVEVERAWHFGTDGQGRLWGAA